MNIPRQLKIAFNLHRSISIIAFIIIGMLVFEPNFINSNFKIFSAIFGTILFLRLIVEYIYRQNKKVFLRRDKPPGQ